MFPHYNNNIKTAHTKGNEMTAQQTAMSNVSRFSSLAVAKEFSLRQKYWTPVLLGDDGRFWVPATNREASVLTKAGYECAE